MGSQMSNDTASTYSAMGVDYTTLDRFKRQCQVAARETKAVLLSHGVTEPDGIRGESAYLLETSDGFLAHVEEGLGTKNLVAEAYLELTGQNLYFGIGIDTVAAIVNDMVTVGALPIAVAMHAAVGDVNWFANENRAERLAAGFAEGCRLAGAVWGAGETPVLKGLVDPSSIVLAGSAIGRISQKQQRIVGDVCNGDAIVFIASSGIHANGITLCRNVAANVTDGYLAELPNGETFGQAIL